jgi:hypothetical protein
VTIYHYFAFVIALTLNLPVYLSPRWLVAFSMWLTVGLAAWLLAAAVLLGAALVGVG